MRIENIAIQNTPKGGGKASIDIDSFSRILEGLIFTGNKEVKKEDVFLEEEEKKFENLIEVEEEKEETDEVIGFFYPGDLQVQTRQMDFKSQGQELEKFQNPIELHSEIEIAMEAYELESMTSDDSSIEGWLAEEVDLKTIDLKPLDIEGLEFKQLFKEEINTSVVDPNMYEENPVKDLEKDFKEEIDLELATHKEVPKTEARKEVPKDLEFKVDMEMETLNSRNASRDVAVSLPEEDLAYQMDQLEGDMNSSLEKEIQRPKNSRLENINLDVGPSRIKNHLVDQVISPEIEDIGLENIQRLTDRIVDSIRVSNLNTSNLMEVQLYPEELGALNIKLKLEDGKITGKILVDNDMVKGLLVNSLGELNQNLAKANINLEKLEIDINTGLNGNLTGENFSENQNSKEFSQGLRNILKKTSNNSIGIRESLSGANQGWISSGLNILV